MRLVSSGEPMFTNTRSSFSNDKREQKLKAKKEERKIWRCGAPGCPRVQHMFSEPELYLCVGRGCKEYADGELTARSIYRCRACYKKYNHEYWDKVGRANHKRNGRMNAKSATA